MTVVVWVAALIAASIHVLVFFWETVLFSRPGVHVGVFSVATADLPAVRLWAFNVGFYNLFLATGAAVGVFTWMAGHETVGRTLVVYTCSFMLLGGVALFASDRMALGRPKGAGVGGVLAESLPPLVALVALAL